MLQMYDAVVAGYLGADLAPQFLPGAAQAPLAELLRPGKLTEVGPLEVTPGGVVANTGLAMAALGCSVALMGLVGDDPLGNLLLTMLEGRGAALNITRTEQAGTAYGIVLAPPQTDRMFLECPGCNAIFAPDHLNYTLIGQSRLFHFGYPPLMPALLADEGAPLETMFARVKALGVATSLDMTLPDPDGPAGQVDWTALLSRVLPHVDIFVPSLEELLYMLAPGQWADLLFRAEGGDVSDLIPLELCDDLAVEAIGLGAGLVFVKAGHRGGYCRTSSVDRLSGSACHDLPAGEGVWLDPLPVDPVRVRNACGAGDAAVAGFLTALLAGETLARAGALAMRVGRDSLYGPDATSGLCSLQQML
jgi:sugar/nucleoside kinase (ribokinase family)